MTEGRKSSFGEEFLKSGPVFHRVEIIRKRLMEIDFTPFTNMERAKYALETAVQANFTEGLVRTDEMIALDDMFLEARLPFGPIMLQLKKDWFGLYLSEGA